MNGFTGDTNFSEIETVSSSTLAYTKFSLTTGQNYKFKVQAVNVVGQGQLSPESVDITAGLVPDAPGDPIYSSSSPT